jgi:GlcNAc-P-P-Und epimerase
MKRCILFGGSGYIGTMLARRFVETQRFDDIVLADIQPPVALPPGTRYIPYDIRKPITPAVGENAEWIFNLAAVHREPGHLDVEYFATNVPGARHVCEFATQTRCENVVFASSIAVYGPTAGATSESAPLLPNTAYGQSKREAEAIHATWQAEAPGRRLIVVRPGVIYGPGDPGNVLRMIRAIRRGYFVFPGSATVRKSYGYVYGLLDALDFAMRRGEPTLTFNYIERETVTIGEMTQTVRAFLGVRAPVFAMPGWLLLPVAWLAQFATGGKSALHPVRVRKAATPTWFVPEKLAQLGFEFRYDFAQSLADWRQRAPGDFS